MNQWTSLQNIRSILEKKWERGIILQETLFPKDLFPLRITLRGPTAAELSDHFSEAREWVSQFINEDKKKFFEIQWDQINNRVLGVNEIPVAVQFDSSEQLVKYLGKTCDFELFSKLTNQLLDPFPQLKSWLHKNSLSVLELASVWEKLIRVVHWIKANPIPGIYIRQMDITDVDTKFVEKYKKLLGEWLDVLLDPSEIFTEHTGVKGFEQRYGFLSKPLQIRFRLLDKDLYIQGLSDLTVRSDEFGSLEPAVETIFITENDVNGLAFPELKNAIVIFGRGYGFDSLKNAHWFRDKKIFYWGDIDTHGFAILNQFRMLFPQTVSMLMDRETLTNHKKHWVSESAPVNAQLSNLTEEELSLYKDLVDNKYGNSVRLEQEVISYDLVIDFLKVCGC
jgi:hypothetical protein